MLFTIMANICKNVRNEISMDVLEDESVDLDICHIWCRFCTFDVFAAAQRNGRIR